MIRSGFKRKSLPERIAPVCARLTVPVHQARISGDVVACPKQDVIRSEPYRRLVAAMPCINCHIEGYSQAAHPPPTGKGIKESDLDCFPLCCVHPGPGGELVDGCHIEFDRMRLVPRADMRSLAGHWAAQTQQEIIADGNWPKDLPRMETLT